VVANTTQILFLYQLRKINRKHAIKVDELHAGCRCFTTCCCEDRGNDDKAAGVMVPCRIRSNPPPRTRCSGLWTGVDVLDRCKVRPLGRRFCLPAPSGARSVGSRTVDQIANQQPVAAQRNSPFSALECWTYAGAGRIWSCSLDR
jgi:hypothetical protein